MDGLAASPSEQHERGEEKSGTDGASFIHARREGSIDGRRGKSLARASLAWEGAGEAEIRDTKSRPRARYTRAETVFSKLGNIPSGFKELLERCFCVFAKIIRIPSGFEELLEMLLFISPKNQIFFQNSPSYRIYA